MNQITDEQLIHISKTLLWAWTYHVSKDEMRASENLDGAETDTSPLTDRIKDSIDVVNEVHNANS